MTVAFIVNQADNERGQFGAINTSPASDIRPALPGANAMQKHTPTQTTTESVSDQLWAALASDGWEHQHGSFVHRSSRPSQADMRITVSGQSWCLPSVVHPSDTPIMAKALRVVADLMDGAL